MTQGNRVAGAGIDGRAWRDILRLLAESVAAGTFVSLVLALAVFIVATQASAATASAGDVRQGTLILRNADGANAQAPLVFTDVHMDVSGVTARVRVTQRFVNPTAQWREGVYVFPLPEKAAVDHLAMRIGERMIEGQVKERTEARRTYEAAKSEGRKASLVEQERPNLFTTSVAHIGPSEEVEVALEYQQALAYDAGTFSLRFPLAITPRYIPAGSNDAPDDVTAAGEGAGAGTAVPTTAVPDADRITPPVVVPGSGAVNPVAIEIDLDAGFPLAHLASTYHDVRIEDRGGHRYRLTLSDGVVPASRDFELAWTPDVGAAPGAALLTEQRDGRKYALLIVLPPAADTAPGVRLPREITYIIDTSGSMEGVSIEQAKEAMQMALDRLAPGDRFNVIEFNSITRALYTAPMPVDDVTLGAARRFVRGLKAQGGTEMLPALTAALSAPRQDGAIRQIVFMTDGAVGNENEILKLIESRLGDRKLFTVGIGPAPNTWFMRKAAEAGRGTFTFIGDVREVKDKMAALIRKIETPVLTDIDAGWPAGVGAHPAKLPDLYAGEPIVVTFELPATATGHTLTLAGVRAGKAWSAALPVDGGADAAGVGVLWARDRIESLMDAKRNGAPADEVRRDVLALALAHHLVSAYTSLVAVDVTPSAPPGTIAKRSALPTNLPEGLDHAAIFGGLPQTATPAPLLLVVGLAALLLAGMLVALQRRAQRRDVPPPAPAFPRALAAVTDAARRVC
jgi:Ca-activated chloride channel family protein